MTDFTSGAYNQVLFRLDIFMKANYMKSDQTVSKGVVLLLTISATYKHTQPRGAKEKSRNWQANRKYQYIYMEFHCFYQGTFDVLL